MMQSRPSSTSQRSIRPPRYAQSTSIASCSRILLQVASFDPSWRKQSWTLQLCFFIFRCAWWTCCSSASHSESGCFSWRGLSHSLAWILGVRRRGSAETRIWNMQGESYCVCTSSISFYLQAWNFSRSIAQHFLCFAQREINFEMAVILTVRDHHSSVLNHLSELEVNLIQTLWVASCSCHYLMAASAHTGLLLLGCVLHVWQVPLLSKTMPGSFLSQEWPVFLQYFPYIK